MTMSEWPAAISRRKARSSFAMSSKCRPVVGSSKRNSFPPMAGGAVFAAARAAGDFSRGAAASARCPASFRRCASPPDSVGTGWPRRRYSSPTSASGASTRCTSASAAKNSSASEMVSSSTSAIDLPRTSTSMISSRNRRPLQSGQRRYTSDRNCISTCSKPLPVHPGQRPLPELKLKVPAVYLRSFDSAVLAYRSRMASHAPT